MNPTLSKNSYKNLNQFNYHSTPTNSLSIINQKIQIKSLQISSQRKNGSVLLVQTSDGSFVIKCTIDVPIDFFFNQLAITLGVNVPIMTTLSCYTQQYSKLIFAIEKYCQDDQILYGKIRNILDFPFYQIMEYIPSISLAHIGNKKFRKYMMNDYKLYSLGICLGFDFIINNNDRFRLLQRGQGNIKNILIQIKDFNTKQKIDLARDRQNLDIKLQNFVFIDHNGNMIDKNKNVYYQNMQKIIQDIIKFQLDMIMYLRDEGELPQHFQKFVQQISLYTQYQFLQEELKKISEGIIYLTINFIKVYEAGEIQKLYQSLKKEINKKQETINYWNTHWNKQLQLVHLSYPQAYYIKVSAIYTTYPELMNQIYDRLNPIMEKNNRNKGRRVSVLKPNDKQKDKAQQEQKEQQNQHKKQMIGNQQLFENQRNENLKEMKKRKWREKLEVFKQKNYS